MVKLAYQLTLKRLHIGPISFLGSLMARISDEETVVKMTAAALVTSKLHRIFSALRKVTKPQKIAKQRNQIPGCAAGVLKQVQTLSVLMSPPSICQGYAKTQQQDDETSEPDSSDEGEESSDEDTSGDETTILDDETETLVKPVAAPRAVPQRPSGPSKMTKSKSNSKMDDETFSLLLEEWEI
jgi:hypothetical protein